MIIKNEDPKNPNSSPITEKIKSVLCMGTKLSPVCVPFKNPLPKNPPEPIAILDWVIFQPDPRGSALGFIKVSTLSFYFFDKTLFKITSWPLITKMANINKIEELIIFFKFFIETPM